MEKYPNLNEAIANVLSRRRAQLGMSKKKLSEEAMIARVHITHLEEGVKSPSLNVIFYLCDALELEPEDFIHQVCEVIKKLEDCGRNPKNCLPLNERHFFCRNSDPTSTMKDSLNCQKRQA